MGKKRMCKKNCKECCLFGHEKQQLANKKSCLFGHGKQQLINQRLE
jgi:hypothetical protein